MYAGTYNGAVPGQYCDYSDLKITKVNRGGGLLGTGEQFQTGGPIASSKRSAGMGPELSLPKLNMGFGKQFHDPTKEGITGFNNPINISGTSDVVLPNVKRNRTTAIEEVSINTETNMRHGGKFQRGGKGRTRPVRYNKPPKSGGRR